MRDPADFDDFYRANAAALTRYAYGLTGDIGAAQDLTQDTFARAWRHWHQLRVHANPPAWLRTVAGRLAMNGWRARRRRAAAVLLSSPPNISPPPTVDVVVLVAALRTLTPPVRQAIVLHHLMDLTMTAIAAETGAPLGTVKARLARGRQELSRLLTSAEEAVDAS